MSVNKHQPHVLVLPEDDANRQLANGFRLDQDLLNWKMQVLEEAGGWVKVLKHFREDQVAGMNRYTARFVILLIDFDNHPERLAEVKAEIPDHLAERVFVLGVLSEPEALKRELLGSLEQIGLCLAQECREGIDKLWQHPQLKHNAPELERLLQHIRPILFPSN